MPKPSKMSKNKNFRDTWEHICRSYLLTDKDIKMGWQLIEGPKNRQQQRELIAYLDSIRGDMDKNEAFQEVINETKTFITEQANGDSKIQKHFMTVMPALHAYTYRTRHYSAEFDAKLSSLFDDNGQLLESPDKHSRLSMSEAGIMYDLAYLYRSIDKTLFEGFDPLPDFYACAKRAHQVCKKIELSQHAQIDQGTLMLFKNTKQAHQLQGPRTGIRRLKDSAFTSITKYGHTATVHVDLDSKKSGRFEMTQSHLEGVQLKDDEITAKHLLYNDICKFDVSALVVKEADKKAFVSELGKEWQKELNHWYSVIERHMHDELQLGNDSAKLSAAINLNKKTYNHIAAKKLLLPKVGHKTLHARTVEQRREEALAKRVTTTDNIEKTPMLCSQYTALTTMLAIDKLNTLINEGEHGHEYGLNMPQISGCNNPIKQPISKRQNMKTMSPGKFFKTLAKQGCITPLDQKPLQKYVKK